MPLFGAVKSYLGQFIVRVELHQGEKVINGILSLHVALIIITCHYVCHNTLSNNGRIVRLHFGMACLLMYTKTFVTRGQTVNTKHVPMVLLKFDGPFFKFANMQMYKKQNLYVK